MTTQQAALTWIDQQVGKSLDYDGHYGAQCVDLVAYYCQFLGVAPYAGNARYWWETGYDGGGQFTRLTANPQPGDIAVFKPNAGNGNAGHISCVRSVTPASFTSLDQNWYHSGANGSPAAWVPHQIDSSIYGYLRPKFNGGAGMATISDVEYEDLKKWKAVFQPVAFNATWIKAGGKAGSPDIDASGNFNVIVADDAMYANWVKSDPNWQASGADLSKLDIVNKGQPAALDVTINGEKYVKQG